MNAQIAWDLYWVQGKSLRAVGEAFDCSVTKVKRAFVAWNFPLRRQGRAGARATSPDVLAIRAAYLKGVPQADLARKYGKSPQRISAIVRDA